ncbi:hypothetical protein BpHYR1_053859 [Brachionus plicatilis]|uniref:Uncharacterized protein n=1 Tax=Brachionus plicatilis TaxID=10195 RepID=A0A3M7Q5J7_BRAPC|nr:hypothetical protein BpHYR1_053859 [Brachionus plicatilis]
MLFFGQTNDKITIKIAGVVSLTIIKINPHAISKQILIIAKKSMPTIHNWFSSQPKQYTQHK